MTTPDTLPPQFAVAYTAPGQNAHNAPMLNVLGMAVGVKLQHAQTYGQFSCVETYLTSQQMGPPPHVHYELNEIMYVLNGTITVLEGDTIREVPKGGYTSH